MEKDEAAPFWRKPFAISVGYQLFLIALVSAGMFHYAPPGEGWRYFDDTLRRWDGQHYVRIAEEGYSDAPNLRTLIVFFPAYPLLIASLASIFGTVGAALVITTLASIAAHALLFHYLDLLGYAKHSRNRVMAVIFASPVSVYFTAIHTEALFLLITVGFLILLKRERFFLAALCGMAAALTRNFGALFLIPYLFACRAAVPRSLFFRRAAYGALILCGTLIYLGINFWIQGDPFAFASHQSQNWFKRSVNPILMYWRSMIDLVFHGDFPGEFYRLILVDRIATLLFPFLLTDYFLLMRERRRNGAPDSTGRPPLPPGFFVWSVAQYLVICSQSFWVSNFRYLALILPAYLMIERVIETRRAYATYLAMSVWIALGAVSAFVRSYWVF